MHQNNLEQKLGSFEFPDMNIWKPSVDTLIRAKGEFFDNWQGQPLLGEMCSSNFQHEVHVA